MKDVIRRGSPFSMAALGAGILRFNLRSRRLFLLFFTSRFISRVISVGACESLVG